MKIYFDNNATTPLSPKAFAAMQWDLNTIPKNPSSITSYGRMARQKLETVRSFIKEYFGLLSHQIVFTSGATEGNHFLVQGFSQIRKGAIITTRIEHPSLLGAIEKTQTPTLFLSSTMEEYFSISELETLVQTHEISFVALSLGNSETGIYHPQMDEVKNLLAFYGIPLVLDCAQALGKIPIDLTGVSGAVFSAHKCHGPKGVGFVMIDSSYFLPPMLGGGSQEHSLRGGTENLAGILAIQTILEEIRPEQFSAMQNLRNVFEKQVALHFSRAIFHRSSTRLSNTSNIYFPQFDGEALLITLDQMGVIASLGSACSSGGLHPSHVLLNSGTSLQQARSSLRFSFGKQNTLEEVQEALDILINIRNKNLALL